MQWTRTIWILIIGLLLGLSGAILSVSKRISIEASNKAVLSVTEFDIVESLAASQGKLIQDGLNDLAKQGLTGVVISEQTIGEIIAEGSAELVTTSSKDTPGQNEVAALRVSNKAILVRVARGLSSRYGQIASNSSPRGDILALPPIDTATLKTTAIGLDPTKCLAAKNAGLVIIGRCSNPLGVTSATVRETITWAKENGASIFLPQGDQVLGRRDSMESLISALRANKMLYASPEFTKLGGDIDVLSSAPDVAIRLHSAQAAELDKLNLAGALERYSKAARERNMRVLLLRPISFASDLPLDGFGKFIKEVDSAILHDGLTSGAPTPFVNPDVPAVAKPLIGLGAALMIFWVIGQVVTGMAGQIAGAGLAAVTLLGALTSGSFTSIAALLISLLVPVTGFLLIQHFKPKWAIVGVIAVFVTAVIAGLMIAGLLNSNLYYIRAKAFSGVKLAVFLPILLVGWFYFKTLCDSKEALRSPITWGAALLSLVIVAALGLMIIRSGNDAPSGVSSGELEFRGFLEQLLPVRPRTKEFLIGFPALFIGLAWYARAGYDSSKLEGKAGWVALLLMLGAIASTDVVNTFCHFHTPVMISLIRVLEGLVLGCIFGSIAWFIVGSRIKVTEN